ncbi:hypothetical protein ACOSQ4_016204 [Xanthoceras sorbifolium]
MKVASLTESMEHVDTFATSFDAAGLVLFVVLCFDEFGLVLSDLEFEIGVEEDSRFAMDEWRRRHICDGRVGEKQPHQFAKNE